MSASSSQRKRQSAANAKSATAKRARYTSDHWDEQKYCDVLHFGTTSTAACPPLTLPSDMPTAALDSDVSLLTASLFPLPVDEFKKKYWRKKAVAILGGGSGRVEQLTAEELCGLDVKEMMAASASEQIFVWMKERHHAQEASSAASSLSSSPSSSSSPLSAAAAQPITSFPLDNPNQLDAALACYNNGSSLYFRSPPELSHRFVRAFNAAVGFNFAGLDYSSASSSSQPKGEIEVFVSRAGHHTGFHFDFMDNFTLQLQGKKTWIMGAVDVQHPVRGFTPHYKDRSTDEMQYKVHNVCGAASYKGVVPEVGDRVTLSAGDVLYHPAGVWHAVSCDEDSISINISLIATTAADLISDAVRQLLWSTEEGRAGLCGTHDEMQNQLQRALGALTRSIEDDQLTKRKILPAAMMAPRRRKPITIDASAPQEEDEFKFISYDVYHINPLMTITPHRGTVTEQEEDGDDDDDSEEDQEEGDEEGEEEDEQKEDKSEVEAATAAVDEAKDNGDGPDLHANGDNEHQSEYSHYVLHHLFGNDSVDSAMRTVLRVHPSLVPAFEAIRTPQKGKVVNSQMSMTVEEVLNNLPSAIIVGVDMQPRYLARCLSVLHELGFLQWRKSKPLGATKSVHMERKPRRLEEYQP